MTEILTESFCERCGTRYTFEPVQPRRGALGRIGTLGRGFRHFVTDPGSSLDEAFAVAKSEQEQRTTNHALEAFHRTFNFCLSCRQYTCGDCWNTVEGRCLSCAPTEASLEPPATRMDTAVVLPPIELAPPPAPIPLDDEADLRNAGPWIGAPAQADGPPEPTIEHEEPVALEPVATIQSAEELDARIAPEQVVEAIEEPAEPALAPFEAAAEPFEPVEPALQPIEAVAEPADAAVPELEQIQESAAPMQEIEAEGEPIDDDAAAAADASGDAADASTSLEPPWELVETEPVAVDPDVAAPAADGGLQFEPGLNLDDQIAEYERRLAAETAAPGAGNVTEPGAAFASAPEPAEAEVEAEAEPAVAAEPEPILSGPEPVIATEPEPQLVEAEAEPVQVAATEPEPIEAAQAEPEPVKAEAEPEHMDATVEPQPAPAAAPEPAPAEAEADAEAEPAVAAEPEAIEPAPFEADAEPESAAAAEPESAAVEELPIAAATPTSPARSEPIPTAIGTPLPASVVDGPLAWPEPDIAAAAFEQQWPDIQVPRRPAPSTPVAPPPAPVAEPMTPVPPPPTAAMRRTTGAHLPSVTAPPPILATHACPSCGLSLSASARFCRRCGTPQQVAT